MSGEYTPNAEWLVFDKLGDFLYFYDLKKIAEYFNITYSEVFAISNYSIRRINMPSPSKGLYIQRLYVDCSRTPRNFKNFKFHRSYKYIYPNIINYD